MLQKAGIKLKKLGVFLLRDAGKMGFNQQTISKLTLQGVLLRVGRGVYVHADLPVSEEIGFEVACRVLGENSAIAGLSALYHYRLVEQVPEQIWVVVAANVRTKDQRYRLMRTGSSLKEEIILKKGYRIVSVERAILEGLKFSTKIGERVALKAARDALAQKKTTLAKLGQAASKLGVKYVLTKYFEAIVA